MDFNIVGPTVYGENENHTSLVVKSGLIHSLSSTDSAVKTFEFPSTYHVVPGFIDMHIHGARGSDVMDATNAALTTISEALLAEGTTSFLATTMTAGVAEIEHALETIKNFKPTNGAEILGVHLEGPFLATDKMGAQDGNKMLLPNVELLQRWQKISGNAIKLVTLAPEQPGSAELIKYLAQQGIIASLGHTNATFAETEQAIAHGCSHATHLFNAMRGLHHREPGVVTAALLSPKVSVELIADGVHVHPAIIELVRRLKSDEKIMLVTDAMRAQCMPAGSYELGGQHVVVNNNEARLSDGTLAGSVLTMSGAVKNMLTFTGCQLRDVIKMASENPAKALGIFDKKGSIALGKQADLIVLNENFEVEMTVCGGVPKL